MHLINYAEPLLLFPLTKLLHNLGEGKKKICLVLQG